MKEKGFTLVELMLAMTFIAFLLLFLIAAIMQVTKLYVKGSAIRQINQTGRQLVDDVASAIRVSGAPIVPAGAKRFCAGGISYVWNVDADSDGSPDSPVNTFTDLTKPLRFISVQDLNADLCLASTTAPIDPTGVVDLVGPEVTVLRFVATQSGRLTRLQLVLSTAGSNIAVFDPIAPANYICEANNEFCAFGDFDTSVYSRKVE